MEHIAALLLIIGCSNSMTECRELSVPVSVFETAEACTAERPFAMGDVQGQAQHVVAKCLAVDPALETTTTRSSGTCARTVHLTHPCRFPTSWSRRTWRAAKKTILANNKIERAKAAISC